jgi:N-acyl homoserine lactone hydrolase
MTLRLHALQTGTVAVKARQRDGIGRGRVRLLFALADSEWTEPLPVLAWAIEHPEGIIVVDTGETARATEPGYFPRWHPYYRRGVRTSVRPSEEIGPRLAAIGISPLDVRWVVLTHLHTDHAGGLEHFPDSEILVSAREFALATGLRGRLNGYLSDRFPPWFYPRLLQLPLRPFGPFPRSMRLTKAGDVILVETPGHTGGHVSVVVFDDEQSIMIAGDTSYTEDLMLAGTVDGVTSDVQSTARTLGWIREYAAQTPTVYLPSHDPGSPRRLAERRVVGLRTAGRAGEEEGRRVRTLRA